jgi:hypothetical protein
VLGDGVVGSEDCFVAELGEREAEVDVTKVGKKERGGGGVEASTRSSELRRG